MNGEWCYFRSYFSKSDCEEILKLAGDIEFQDARVGIDNEIGGIDESARRSKIKFIYKGDWRFDALFTQLWKCAIQANDEFFNFHVSRLNYVQLSEYDSSYLGEYKEHHDVFWLNNDPFYHRKLSCVIQLSDPNDYEGGDFELTGASTLPPQSELREQGTILFFPSFLNHKANQVTKGTRYSLVAWFEGPKWR